FLDDRGNQRSDWLCQPRSSGVQHPFVQSGAAADLGAVLSKWNDGHGELGSLSGKNSARLLYALYIQRKGRAGCGENNLRPPSGPVSLVESAEEVIFLLRIARRRMMLCRLYLYSQQTDDFLSTVTNVLGTVDDFTRSGRPNGRWPRVGLS